MTFPTRPGVRRWATACLLVAASGLSLAACSDTDDAAPTSGRTSRAPGPGSASPSDEPGAEPGAEPAAEAPSEPSGTAVPVYFVGDGPSGPALFREFHRVEGDPLTEAARLVTGGGEPDDPDYRTLWPQVEVSTVSATDGVLLVRLPADAFTERPDGMSAREADLAVQQLVYTLQGVQQERVPVMVQRDGGAARLFGLPTDAAFEAAGALDTLNHVNITSPAEGDSVAPGGSVRVSGVANSFEATVVCELLVDDRVVGSGPITAEGWMDDRLFPFEGDLATLEAPPGPATLRCSTDDPSGGAEGSGPSVDTKAITLR